MMGDDKSKQLRAHRKVDYFEEFSDGDQEEYEDGTREVVFKLPAKRKRPKKKESFIGIKVDANHEPKEVLSKQTAKRNKDKSNHEKKREEISDSIIPLSDLNNQELVSNSDIMLCLLEICLNSEKYGITLGNSSRSFWENISHNEEIFHSLKKFKPETLRKYWRRMRLTFKYKKLIEAIKSNQAKLNNEDLKLLSAINSVCDYISSPGKGLDAYIAKYSIKNVKKIPTAEGTVNKNETDNEEDSQDNIINTYHLNYIKEMVDLLSACFPNLLKSLLYQKLIEVSGNVENAYLYIKNPDYYSYLAFSKEEDEVVASKQEDSIQYKALVKKKGYELFTQRQIFLTS